ncbi:MAG: C40 family peptidase [Leptospiraceae bacterium]|nr:C40 family peptidase [Leptospiraceae bacterium]
MNRINKFIQQPAALVVLTLMLLTVGHLWSRDTVFDGVGLVQLAQEHIGTPYEYGGSSPNGFDCSGLTSYVYKSGGYKLPRSASDQYAKMIPVVQPHPGDLVFFKTAGDKVSHVGIYTGDFQFIHAPSSGKKVRYDDIRSKYWKRSYAGARTIFNYKVQ